MARRIKRKFYIPIDIYSEICANSKNVKELVQNLLVVAFTEERLSSWASNWHSGKSCVPHTVYYALKCAVLEKFGKIKGRRGTGKSIKEVLREYIVTDVNGKWNYFFTSDESEYETD
ncbi:unnamed protein product [Allacma fusca]|uniref:Uncharacterized protein n=1 Tax=Allacma fusca TaxID=39272 RepID=A0A8J2KG61_9HEXA|nr:unnamed protein product [Allacma fusca]